MDDLKLRESDDIQGDVLAGFKKDQMTLLFLKFEDPARARTWVKALEPQISTTRQVATFNAAFSRARRAAAGGDPQTLKATWTNVSFTYEGLRELTGKDPLPSVRPRSGLEAFKQGSDKRALGDTGDSAPEMWLFGNGNGKGQPVHAVLTVASDTVEDLQAAVRQQREACAAAKIVIVFQQDAATLPGSRRGKEHFGFKDGVSEPGVIGFDEPDPARPECVKGHHGTRLIPPGEFVVGHDRVGGEPHDMPEWAENGSFQVVRRLGQDVPGFWSQVAGQLKVLKQAKVVPPEATVEWLAARLVGRWRSGTPVATCPHADKPSNALAGEDNDFGYRNDPEGFLTPLFSHLRKTNPRDGLQEKPGDPPFDENPVMDRRRIIRRGAPYGAPFDPASEGGGPDEKRGLLFICYQSDLVQQFEFIQKAWIDSPDFPPNRTEKPGPDGMVGAAGMLSYETPGKTTQLTLSQFVVTEGSVYCFVPSLRLLRLLGDGRLTDKPPTVVRPTDAFLPLPGMQQVGGKSWYWAYGTGGDGAVCRTLSIADGDEHKDVRERPDRPLSTWPCYAGVAKVDVILPVPDEQQVNGRSRFWLFHTVEGRQVYRLISIADGAENGLPPEQAGRVDRPDRPLSAWASFGGIQQVDAFLPVPDMQRINGKSHYWVFHTLMGSQVYRLISISDGSAHQDAIERGDLGLNMWRSLNGITRVDEFLPVPDMQRINGLSLFWVFHQDKYRIIVIRDGQRHEDQITVDDRPLTVWTSLTS